MDPSRISHVPAQPRQRHHTATCTYTGTSTHGPQSKARPHPRCPNPHPRPHYSQAPASYTRHRSPGPPAVPHSPLRRLRPHNPHHHNHLIRHQHHVLVQHSTPQAAEETSQTGPQTRPHREQPRGRQGPRPDEARVRSWAETQDRRQAAKPKPKPKPCAATAAQARPLKDVLYDIQPKPSQAQRQQRPARRPPTVTDAAATTVMAVRAAVEARRTSFRHLSKPPPQANGQPPTRPERRQGPPTAAPPPYQPSMSANIQQMPHHRPHSESQPNPEGETVRAYPRVQILPHPHSPRTPTAQDYEESPRPATATSPRDHITPTHAHSSAGGHGPAQGQWWQRWTHTQLWELRKWARAELSLERPGPPAPQGVGREPRPPAGGEGDARGRMGSHTGRCAPPPGRRPPQPPGDPGLPVCPQALAETLQETQRDGLRL